MVGVYMQGQEIVINQLLRVEKCSDAYLNDILKDMADSPTLKKETMYFSYLNNDHTYTIHFEVYEAATVTQGDIIRGVALGIQTDQTLKGNVLFSDSLSHNSINKILADNNKDEEAYTGYLAQEESEIQDVFQYETKELSFPISQNFNREVTGMAVEYQVHKTPVYNECVYVLAEVVQSYEKEDNQMGLQICRCV